MAAKTTPLPTYLTPYQRALERATVLACGESIPTPTRSCPCCGSSLELLPSIERNLQFPHVFFHPRLRCHGCRDKMTGPEIYMRAKA